MFCAVTVLREIYETYESHPAPQVSQHRLVIYEGNLIAGPPIAPDFFEFELFRIRSN